MIGLVAAALAGPAAEGEADLRAIGTFPGVFALDPGGTTFGWGPVLDTRLRLSGGLVAEEAHPERLRVEAELDLFTGQLLGSTWSGPSIDERGREELDALTLDGVVPRVLKVGGRTPWFDVELGLETSHWGLGLLVNDGDHDPLFGRSDFGDRVVRLRLGTAPFTRGGERYPLLLVLAVDRGIADELARAAEGDRVWQGVGAALYQGPDHRELGGYAVVRDQTTDAGHTAFRAVDGYVSWGFGPARVAAEGVFVSGRTDEALSYASPTSLPVRAGGFAVRSSIGSERARALANVAYASGDRDPTDARVGDLRFDRDYDVGMVLFDELLADLDLSAWREVNDPALSAAPPSGADTLAAEGAFHQALALQPAATAAVAPWLELRAGMVLAWSTAPIAQPYTTFRAGGAPTNHLGGATSGRYLGTELDWAAIVRSSVEGRVRGQALLQIGQVWPSAELAPELDRLDHVLLTGRVEL